MKRGYQILSVLLGVIFIVSSTGVMIYKTHCACTGNEQVSVYVMPETCESDFHVHHTHDQSGNEKETTESCCHECTSHAHDCGCTTPEVSFFKLINPVNQKEIQFVKAQPIQISVSFLCVFTNLIEFQDVIETNSFNYDPPPNVESSKNFLIQIHQLKIPISA